MSDAGTYRLRASGPSTLRARSSLLVLAANRRVSGHWTPVGAGSPSQPRRRCRERLPECAGSAPGTSLGDP
jgi:hypothetical protein